MNTIGVVPMAGRATRLHQLPCSKEILPVNTRKGAYNTGEQPRVVCEYLLEKMHMAGVTQTYIILREGKWDIPACLGDGSAVGLHLAYLMMGRPFGTPYSVDQAFPYIQHANVAFGFPDMILGPEDIFAGLLDYRNRHQADIVLGLFPADRPDKVDMVELSGPGKVERIVTKPQQTDLRSTWGVAVWTPEFSQFMHEYLASHQQIASEQPELSMGDIVQAGIRVGLGVYGVPVSQQPYIDIGTSEDLEGVIDLRDESG